MRYFDAVRRRRALRRSSIYRIGELPEDTIGRVIGTVRPVERVLKAPLTGRDCVCYAVTVHCDAMLFLTRTIRIHEQQGVSFVLEDDSGRAIVQPDGAELYRKRWHEETWGTFSKPSLQAYAFLVSRSPEPRDWGSSRPVVFREAIVEAGAKICVAGPGVREPDPDAQVDEGYRTAPRTRLRFTSSPKFRILIGDPPPQP